MNRVTDRVVCLWAMYCLMVVVAGTSVLRIARGQEVLPPPVPTPPGAHPHQILIADPGGQGRGQTIVIVTHSGNVPLVGRVFQNAGQGPTCCEEMLQRVGVDCDHDAAEHCLGGGIDVHVFGDLPHGSLTNNHATLRLGFPGLIIDNHDARTGQRRVKASLLSDRVEQETAGSAAPLPRLGCPSVAAGECTCAGEPACGSECAAGHCPGCKCDECQSAMHVAESDEPTCGDESCALARLVLDNDQDDGDEITDFHPLKLMQHIAALMAEKAAAQAALEARDQADEKLSELVETITELIADNAALDAKLEAQAEHARLRETITDLAAENARLKAHVELAAERAELAKNAFAMALENERLKLRLADLEQRHAAAEAARTAAKPRPETK
jgi:hypothetical protein